jgi:hypothetical protein
MPPLRTADQLEFVERGLHTFFRHSLPPPRSLLMVIRSRIFAALLSLALLVGYAGQATAEPEVTASYIDAVTKFLAAQNAAAVIEEQMTYSVAQQAFGNLAAQGIAITEPMQAIILDEAKKSFGSKFADVDFLARLYAPIYVGKLSEADLRELTVFWTSPLGIRMLAVNRALSEGTLFALQEASQPLLPAFHENVDARLAAAGITQQP